MPLWLLIVLLVGLIKLPIVALMLWIPFRDDEAMRAPSVSDSTDDDGGSKTPPLDSYDRHPRKPAPRRPRRGPHGSASPPAPRRVRTSAVGKRRVRS